MDPSLYAQQFERQPGVNAGIMSHDTGGFEGSHRVEVGGRDHLEGNAPLSHDALRIPENLQGHAEPELKASSLGHIPRTQNVAGTDHVSAPAFQHDELRANAAIRGHMEPWQKAALMPEMRRDKIEYEGSCEVDVGGRDHFGAGGEGGNWVPANYVPPTQEPAKAKAKWEPGNDRPNSPSMRFARGEKVTPFHVRRQSTLSKIGQRASWDTLKHLPGHNESNSNYRSAANSDKVGQCDMFDTNFHYGFQRRRQTDINQDAERKAATAQKEVRVKNQAAVRKRYIGDNTNKNCYNPITGEYFGRPHNPAFQEMITKADGAMYQDRYQHHVRRRLAGPKDDGECSDCKPVCMSRREKIVREGCSQKKHNIRGSVKDLFRHHDGYEKALVAALPNIPLPAVTKVSKQCT